MALPQDLLNLARDLVDRNLGAPAEADLRRGISTAYYALFHLLVLESTTRLVSVTVLRPRVARSFDHRIMKVVCQEYASMKANSAGIAVPQEVQDIAVAFVALQLARHRADYDTGIILTQVQAKSEVTRAESAFSDWASVQSAPAADEFLAELLCRGIPRR